jgi:phage virion morphogenesis protein
MARFAMLDMPVNIQGQKRIKAMVGLIKANPTKRRNILRKVARKAKTINNKRKRAQQDIDGQPFAKRKKGSAKMFRKISKYLRHTATSEQAKLYFTGNVGKVAYAHHKGIGDNFNVKTDKSKKQKNNDEFSGNGLKKPATRAQAKRLVKTGEFRIDKRKSKSGKGRIPTIKWVVENLTIGQVGAILRSLKLTQKTQWRIERKPRPWLGMNPQDTAQAASIIIDELAR